MADVKEYLIRFKGDTSQIEAAADRLQAKVERISDTEVKLRVNLGKDKADVKPFLDMIKKIDPEVHAKMIVDGLDDLKTAEDRLEQIRKIEKDIGSVDAIKSTLMGYSKAVNDAEKKAGETLDNTETIRILKEALDYVESIGDAANNATLKPLINGLKEAVPYYSELKDYKPKNLLADKDVIKKTRDALKSNLSLVETPKLTADTSEATDAVEKLKDKTDEVVDGMSQTGKVKIFDGISTQIYDVIEDADKLEAKLKEIASSWGQVGWHGGSDPRSGHLSDTLGRMLRTGDDGPSAGTGTYFTQNLKDVLNWIGSKSHKDVFAADLSRLSGMVTLPSDDYFYDLSDLFKAINAFVANDFFPNKRYETVLEDFKSNSPTETLQKIFKYYENIFKDMGISFEQFSTFINGQKSFLADYEKTHIDMPEEDFFNSLENNITTRFNKTFATNFFQMFTGASGINASNLHLTDSSELGTVIFDFLRQSIPMIDFGGNTNIAEAFYEMTLGNLIKSKARNPDVDLEDLLYTYTGRKRKEGLLPEHTKLLEEARQIQSGAKPATYQELNGDRIQEEIKAQKELANVREEAANASKEEVPYESHADEINKEAEAYEKYAEAQRLAAIQNEYSRGMGVESIGGFDPERQYMRLNELAGEYEQTMREIDDLQHSGSNNEDIQERIALLKLLAQNQIEAFARSIPNDMTPSTAVAEAFGSSPKIWGDYLDGVYNRLASENDNYVKSVWEKISSLAKELPEGFVTNLGDRVIDPNSLDVMSSIAEETKRIKEAGEEAGDEYQRQLDEEAQELAEKKAREEEYRRQEEEAAREAAEEELRIAEEKAQREAEIEEEARRRTEKEMEEYERQEEERQKRIVERAELEKKVRDANEQALREQEAQRSPAIEHDVFADQYAKETEGERQLTSAINERAEAADRAAMKLKNAESQNVVDDILKRQELTRKYNEQLYESKGALPSPDDYDSYYDSEGISRFIEQTKEARIETENLNDAIHDGSVQSDDISKHTEDLKEDSKAANENAEANKKAADAKKESASVQQEPERDLSAESLDLDKEASFRRLDVLEKKLREVGGASKELENDLVDARKAIGSAVDTKELGVANKKVRNITDDVNEYIKQKNIEVDYSDQLSSFEKLKNEIVESTAVSKAFKDSVKGAFDSFKDSSASTKNIERIKEAIKETTKEFKEFAKASATDNSKANTRFSNYVDRLNSYNLDKYTPEVRQKILDLRDEISKMPKDAAGNFKIDLNDEEVVKQVNRIDGAMKDLKAAVSSADGVVANGISVKKLNEQMAQFVNKNHKLTAEYKQEIKELRQALSEEGLTKSGYMDILGQYKDLQARASDEGLVGGVGNLENLGNQIKRMSTNFVAQYFSLYDIVRYAKEIGQSVTEINSAQTELRKVSDASQTRIQENFKTSAETAQELGATISDVIKSTSDWARLGYSVDDAETLARNTTLFQTVGDNLTQESASEYMTSIMKGYQYDADQSESIIDKVNEVANNYSIDTQGLGEALQRSASAFNTAHTDLDKSIAIITASNEVLQDPEKVGTMWNTKFLLCWYTEMCA